MVLYTIPFFSSGLYLSAFLVFLFCFSSMMCRVAAFSDSTVVLLQRMNKMTLYWMLRCEDAASSCVQFFFSVPALLLLISPVPLENCSVFSLIIPYSLRTLVQLIFWLIRHLEWVFASARVLPASVCAFQHKSTEMHFTTSHEWIVKGHYCHWKLFWAKILI